MTNTLGIVSRWSCLALIGILPAVGMAQDLEFTSSAAEPAVRLSSRRPAKPLYIQEVSPTTEASVLDAAADENASQQDSLAPLQTRQLSTDVKVVSIEINGIGTGVLPDSKPSGAMLTESMLPDGMGRGATYKQVNWKPSMVFHHPLYFEEAMLERHGHDRFGLLQPLASGARFYTTIALYPYLQSLRKPSECIYALGNRRPGTCAPKLRDSLPWDKKAAATQVLATGGLFWAAPL